METEFSLSLGLIAISIFILIEYILFVAAEWKILTKAGEKGWKALIPVYDVYLSHHIVGMSHVWFILEVIVWIIELVLEIFEGIPDWIGLVFGIAITIFTIISELVHILRLCDCFGKGRSFRVGMILIPNVFWLILAFGDSKFQKHS